MKKLRTLGIVVLILVAGNAVYWYLEKNKTDDGAPMVTQTPLADDLVVLYEPLPGQHGITSPLKVRGKARGTWFFEASFPVVLTDSDGRVITQVPAQAKSDWMTTDFVEFEATLVFDAGRTAGNWGTLTLQKDNPSGLPEHDDSREITVFFAK